VQVKCLSSESIEYLVGQAKLPTREVSIEPSKCLVEWFGLFDKNGNASGEIQMSICRVCVSNVSAGTLSSEVAGKPVAFSGLYKMTAGSTMPQFSSHFQTNTWSKCASDKFELRVGPNYDKNKQKKPSGESLMELVGVEQGLTK
jgi:hypothetical protein